MGQFQSSIPRIAEEIIREEVKKYPVVLYTKSRCSYCIKAKQLLDKERIEYREHDLDAHERLHPADHRSYVNGLIYVTKQTSVPQVFICGKFIGGFTELQQLKNAGELFDAIAECSSPHPMS